MRKILIGLVLISTWVFSMGTVNTCANKNVLEVVVELVEDIHKDNPTSRLHYEIRDVRLNDYELYIGKYTCDAVNYEVMGEAGTTGGEVIRKQKLTYTIQATADGDVFIEIIWIGFTQEEWESINDTWDGSDIKGLK